MRIILAVAISVALFVAADTCYWYIINLEEDAWSDAWCERHLGGEY